MGKDYQYYDDVNSYAVVPGKMKTSVNKLKPFVKELGFFGKFKNDIYRSPGRLDEHLDFCAANAAKIIAIDEQIIVSAISTDVDVAILLRFNLKSVSTKNLKVDDRLLSINSYGTYEDANNFAQIDLVEGPQSTRLYSICYPVIADFVTSDNEALKATTSKISDTEWKRLDILTDIALNSEKYIRDGNPYLSWHAPMKKISNSSN